MEISKKQKVIITTIIIFSISIILPTFPISIGEEDQELTPEEEAKREFFKEQNEEMEKENQKIMLSMIFSIGLLSMFLFFVLIILITFTKIIQYIKKRKER